MKPWLLFALALALIGAGCGEDGPPASTSGATAAQSLGGEAHRGGEASIEEFGSEAEGSEREAILAAFLGYLSAIAAEEHATACSHLSSAVQRSLAEVGGSAGGGCGATLSQLLAPNAPQIAREQANGALRKVRVEDDRAFVVFEAPGAKLYQLTMVEEDGEWKAAVVSAVVLVPEL